MGLYSETLFPWMMDKMLGKPEILERRERLAGGAAGDVLEIGFGTGATLPFYDRARVRSLSVVEPSSGMNRRARERIEKLGWKVRAEPSGGEHLPFDAASFDCVVTSLTLCTVNDPAQVLAEIRRVLKPGGTFRFFEHVASDDARRRRWQDRLNPMQRVIGVGCNLNRDTVDIVRRAGLTLGDAPLQVVSAFGPWAAYLPIVEGVAVKA